MNTAPYRHSYERLLAASGIPVARHVPNVACCLTDRGADHVPEDLGGCIRREWRVIYYSARRAAYLPLWAGADDFEVLMTVVLMRLSQGFKPILPIQSGAAAPEDDTMDWREERIFQPSCRVFRWPVFGR
jgi:hypothetical protein